jgi:hypothetical protein
VHATSVSPLISEQGANEIAVEAYIHADFRRDCEIPVNSNSLSAFALEIGSQSQNQFCAQIARNRAGDIVMVDSINFTTLFGGTDSLKNFWKNIATAK